VPRSGLGIVANHRELVGRRHVPVRREIRGRPMRRDREHKLDLADIGGEPDASTHTSTLAQLGRRPKRLDRVVQAGLVRAAMAKIVLTQPARQHLKGNLPCTSSGRSSSGSSQV
jgi:hypothetical protein